MGRKLDRFTTAGTAGLLIFALLACKKKKDPEPATVDAAPTPVATAEPTPEPKKDDVKRYADKEIADTGTVRVKTTAKVYREADTSTAPVISLGVGTLVNRKARMGTFLLIDYPSGVGELSPGWVESRFIDQKITKLDAGILVRDAGVVVRDASVQAAPTVTAPPTVTVPPTVTAPPPTAPPTVTPPPTVTAPPTATAPPATPDAGRIRRAPKRLE